MIFAALIRHLKYALHLLGRPVTHKDVDKLESFAKCVWPISKCDDDPAWWARLFLESARLPAGSADAELMTPAVVRRVVLTHESGAADEFLREWFERCRDRRERGDD